MATGTFTATGAGATSERIDNNKHRDGINVTLSGTFVAAVRPERSFDAGTTWHPVTYIDGSAISWTAPISTSVSELQHGTLYRLNCTSYTSGTVTWELGR